MVVTVGDIAKTKRGKVAGKQGMISVLPHEGEKDEFHEIEVTWRKNSDPTGTYL